MRDTDGDRLCWGTLTRVPVRAPEIVDAHSAGGAMLSAPLVGVALGVVAGAIAWGTWAVRPDALGALLGSVLALAFVAWATRAIHLDGLADTVDALGSGQPAEQALAIARRSDIGPFGVVALVLALAIDAVASAGAVGAGTAMLAFVVALVSGRLMLPLACIKGIPAARADGLGAAVAGSVHAGAAAAVVIGWTLIITITAAAIGGDERGRWIIASVSALLGGLVAGSVMLLVARRRLGGITGDVLGALVEIATAAAFVVFALVGGS